LRKFVLRLLLACWMVIVMTGLPGSISYGQDDTPQSQLATARENARNLLAQLSPRERVGQLFLVTLSGSTFDVNSQIYDLVAKQHVGGVILQRSNDNFTTLEDTPLQVYQLVQQLQQAEYEASQAGSQTTDAAVSLPQYLPLLIGLSQEGDHYPNDQILNGLTPLPDLMSIGATWNTDLAGQVGEVMGAELSALGINLYLGPALDVLDTPQKDTGEDLGVRTFGGDPYWVGKMGQSYISGLHEGSSGRLLVIAKHFPGRGSSDRSPDVEVATVRKSLEQLEEFDLAPFFAVSGVAADDGSVVDGLFVSHIRYQGFQGNIRATTRPVSSDAAALEQILKLEPLVEWRDQGGLMVSDNLGSQAVRRFYDPTGNTFDARTAAREAFFAGNDLLYVDKFVASNDPDSYTTIVRTIDFFTQKYEEDAAFAQRVDASVERILTAKYRLYPQFTLEQVVPAEEGLANVGESEPVTFDVARRSVTLISPDATELNNTLPSAPGPRDRIVFLTDVQAGRQCSTCAEQVTMPVNALESTVLRLYGPRAGGQVSQSLMISYSFADLYKFLNETPATPEERSSLETDLSLANWVVVSMLKPDSTRPETQAFQRLLSERADILRNKKIIVFAFGAPYYLDATDISKLTAYYGLYSKTAPFVDVAARILFQELVPTGALPVSVPGIGYDLIYSTSPDPAQIIPLTIDNGPEALAVTPASTQEPPPAPVFRVGDLIPMRTGVILDHNHHPVPDGTPVRFNFSVISESAGSTQTQVETETVDGVARYMYRIERPGLHEIHASTEEGSISNLLRLDITSGVSAGITMVAPTQQPTETPTPTPTVTITVTPTPTVTPVPVKSVGFQDWFAAFLIAVASAAAVAWFGIRQAIARWGLRWALCGLIGGMIAYNYLVLKLPGSEAFVQATGTQGILVVTVMGILAGWIAGLIWRQIAGAAPRSADERPSGSTGPKSQSS